MKKRIVWKLAFVLAAFPGSGCVTSQLWQSLESSRKPTELLGVSITNDNLLHMKLRFDDRRIYHVLADLEDQRLAREQAGKKWFQVQGRLLGRFEGDLPATERVVIIAPKPSDFWYERDSLRQGDDQAVLVSFFFPSLDIHDPRREPPLLSVLLPVVPIVWSDARPIATVLITPITAAVDLVTLPFQAAFFILLWSSGDCL